MRPQFKLIRIPNCHNEFTEGELFQKNKFLFDTLEDPIRDLNGDGDLLDEGESKVYGDTAIPQGIYEMVVTFSDRFQMDMVLLKKVKHFKGVRVHWGATKKNTKGCILVGKRIATGRLLNTGGTKEMVSRVNSITKSGKKCYIEIL